MFQGRLLPPFSKQTKGYKLIAVGLGKFRAWWWNIWAKHHAASLLFVLFRWLRPDVGYLARWSWLGMDALLIFTFLRESLLQWVHFSLLVFPDVQQPAVSSGSAEVQWKFIQANQLQEQCDSSTGTLLAWIKQPQVTTPSERLITCWLSSSSLFTLLCIMTYISYFYLHVIQQNNTVKHIKLNGLKNKEKISCKKTILSLQDES